MSLEKTTELYASVLRQLLPEGVYDTAEQTHVADDVYAHAKVLAQADIDAHRLLQVLETIPVDLLADYEREYGLPMQCMVPGTQSIEERINVLRWVRTNRNVLNRSYVEQLLAIFGVTLVDIIKYFPMQCTAPCNAPVNTEQLRYKVFLRLQYPMTADMSCIIENYLPAYLRVDWVIDMPWGGWILNSKVTFTTNSTAHYTAFKTNQRDYYDSYANLDLTDAVIKSLSDADMQQWQAVKDAANELTGVTDWVVDTTNAVIKYNSGDKYRLDSSTYPLVGDSILNVCWAQSNQIQEKFGTSSTMYFLKGYGETSYQNYRFFCSVWSDKYGTQNPYLTTYGYADPGVTEEITFNELAFKIISNTSSSNQAISLLAEAYLEAVANSIFNTESSKQFVKLSDLLSQFELNKTLRT